MNNIRNILQNNKYDLKTEYINARRDDVFKKIVDSLPFKEDVLMKYTSRFEEVVEEYKNCMVCKSLLTCKNKMEGYSILPQTLDDKLTFSYKPCKYMRKHLNDTKYQKNVIMFDIPKEIRDAKMNKVFIDDKNRIPTIEYLTNFLKNYKNNPNQKGLYLNGNFGSGKTYLVSAMFNELAKSNISSVVIYWPEYLRSLKATFQNPQANEFNTKFNTMKKAPLLLIDDLGAEGVSSWSRDEILGSVLQYRMQEKLPTFITSNLTLTELEIHLAGTSNKVDLLKAKRIMERIGQLCINMKLVSSNNRK